eukprot:COSAG05_NODE_9190_length_641_cov_0.839483_2_plen_40_part_01
MTVWLLILCGRALADLFTRLLVDSCTAREFLYPSVKLAVL